MKKIKNGDIVTPTDGSYVIGIDEDGKFDHGVYGNCINGRDFEVMATGCVLPSRRGYDEENNTIIRALDNGQVIFIRKEQLRLSHRCNSCPSCGQQL